MKLIEKIKKHDNIIVLLIITIVVSAMTFWVLAFANDELWAFSSIYKMVNGYTIYKDINVIITPLFYYVGEIFFRLFGSNYLVFRVYQTLIFIFMWFSVYQLFKALKVKKINSLLYLLGIMFVYRYVMAGSGFYNTYMVAFYIIGIILLIKEKFKPKTNAILQGIIIFLIFMSKQNMAVYYIIANIVYKIISNKNTKETIKSIFIELLTSFILLMIFLFTLYLNNNLYDFINYTILGIGEFAEENTTSSYIYIVAIQVVLLIAYMILAGIKKIPFENNIRKNIKILCIFSLSMIFFAYPIFNMYHMYIEAILTIVTTLYIIDKLIIETLLENKIVDIIKKVVIAIICIYFVCICVINNVNYIQCIYKKEPYFGAVFKEETVDEINEMVEYIKEENSKGYEVKILSYYSNLYMNVLNKNNGVMDLIFNGNMGKDGAEGVIKQIESSKNTKYLITKEEDNVYQESKKIREYVSNNLTQIGEISRFLIFE